MVKTSPDKAGQREGSRSGQEGILDGAIPTNDCGGNVLFSRRLPLLPRIQCLCRALIFFATLWLPLTQSLPFSLDPLIFFFSSLFVGSILYTRSSSSRNTENSDSSEHVQMEENIHERLGQGAAAKPEKIQKERGHEMRWQGNGT